jgi:hypothetical protein
MPYGGETGYHPATFARVVTAGFGLAHDLTIRADDGASSTSCRDEIGVLLGPPSEAAALFVESCIDPSRHDGGELLAAGAQDDRGGSGGFETATALPGSRW